MLIFLKTAPATLFSIFRSRAGFRLFWTWKVRRGNRGRPLIAREVRDLIRKMCRENPGWGAPRIHRELLKLGLDISESSVSKYMVRWRNPGSQTWRTFLENHLTQLVSIDFRVEEILAGCRLPLAVSTVSGFVPV